MPYIKQTRIDELMQEGEVPQTAGELNFFITNLCLEYINERKSYEIYNSVVGALESCKLEFYRRMVVPYEETKIEENGDVYPA